MGENEQIVQVSKASMFYIRSFWVESGYWLWVGLKRTWVKAVITAVIGE